MRNDTAAAVAPLLACLLLSACTSEPGRADPAGGPPGPQALAVDPGWGDLGPYRRSVTTSSREAQRRFDEGLVLAYGFNHDGALAAFEEAARLDPRCAMAWWGIAYASGPHINLPVQDPARAQRALEALERARGAEASEVEQALIEAQAERFSADPRADRAALDGAYAEAMAAVWRRFPGDPDVGALYAESLMNVHPWDLWTADGQPKNDVETILATLEAVLAASPNHPHANHLYVHAVEASPDPGRALPSADRLRTLVPGSSHLLHMPSHIDVRVGQYAQASAANERAIEVDRKNRDKTPPGGFYQLYMAHNRHMLAFASMMEGRSQAALEAARALVAEVPEPFLTDPATGPIADGFAPVVLHVLVRFGRWEDVLEEPPFPDFMKSSNAVRHYARGVSFAALGRLDEAERELRALEAAIAAIDDRPIGNNPARLVLGVPHHMLAGELLFRRGKLDEGLARLEEAVKLQDTLLYDEPPDWMTPARHPLAASLMAADRPAEAEEVLRADLRHFPENGWALVGLARSLAAQGKAAEAEAAQRRFEAAWARADVAISSPCLCQPGG